MVTCVNFQAKEVLETLNCYLKQDTPYLRLAPIKVELAYRNPDIFLFRDVISDREIGVLQELSKPGVSFELNDFLLKLCMKVRLQLRRAKVIKDSNAIEEDLEKKQKGAMAATAEAVEEGDEANMFADYRIAEKYVLANLDNWD